MFVGVSYRNQPNQEATGAKMLPLLERGHNTDPAVTLNDIRDPRPRLSVALSIVLEPMRDAREGHIHVGPNHTCMSRASPCAAGAWRQPNATPYLRNYNGWDHVS